MAPIKLDIGAYSIRSIRGRGKIITIQENLQDEYDEKRPITHVRTDVVSPPARKRAESERYHIRA